MTLIIFIIIYIYFIFQLDEHMCLLKLLSVAGIYILLLQSRRNIEPFELNSQNYFSVDYPCTQHCNDRYKEEELKKSPTWN